MPLRLRQDSGKNRNGSCPEPSWLATLPVATGPSPTSASGWRLCPEGGSRSGQVSRARRREARGNGPGRPPGPACAAAHPESVRSAGLGGGGGDVCCTGLCPRAGAASRNRRGPYPRSVRRTPAPPGLEGLGAVRALLPLVSGRFFGPAFAGFASGERPAGAAAQPAGRGVWALVCMCA